MYGCARSRTYISRLCMMHVRMMSSTRPLAFRLTTAEAAAITRSLLTLYTRTAPRVGVRVVSLRKFAPHTATLHVCFDAGTWVCGHVRTLHRVGIIGPSFCPLLERFPACYRSDRQMKAKLHPTGRSSRGCLQAKSGIDCIAGVCVIKRSLPSVTRVTQTEHHETTHFSS